MQTSIEGALRRAAELADSQAQGSAATAVSADASVITQAVTAAIGGMAPVLSSAMKEGKSSFPMVVEDLRVSGASRPYVENVVRFAQHNAMAFENHSSGVREMIDHVVGMVAVDGTVTARIDEDAVMSMCEGVVEPRHDSAWAVHLRSGMTEDTLDMYIEDTTLVHASGIRTVVQLLNAALEQSKELVKARVAAFMKPARVQTQTQLMQAIVKLKKEYKHLVKPEMGRQAIDYEEGYEALECLLGNWGTVLSKVEAMWLSDPDRQGEELFMRCLERARKVTELLGAAAKPVGAGGTHMRSPATGAGGGAQTRGAAPATDSAQKNGRTATDVVKDQMAAAAGKVIGGVQVPKPSTRDMCVLHAYKGYTCTAGVTIMPQVAYDERELAGGACVVQVEVQDR